MLTFEVYKDVKGEFRWRLKAVNQRVIADSGEGYRNKADCTAAIALFKSGVAGARIVDLAV